MVKRTLSSSTWGSPFTWPGIIQKGGQAFQGLLGCVLRLTVWNGICISGGTPQHFSLALGVPLKSIQVPNGLRLIFFCAGFHLKIDTRSKGSITWSCSTSFSMCKWDYYWVEDGAKLYKSPPSFFLDSTTTHLWLSKTLCRLVSYSWP